MEEEETKGTKMREKRMAGEDGWDGRDGGGTIDQTKDKEGRHERNQRWKIL